MKTVLKNAGVLTMKNQEILNGFDILFDEGKIIRIAPGLETSGVNTIDCTGKYIIPGLFDMHVHINSSDMMPLFFANGVTSVRSMWGFPLQLEWKKKAEHGDLLSPYIYTTGPLTDGAEYWKGCLVVKTPDEAEKAVHSVLETDGYIFFKTYPSIPKDAYLHLLAVAKKHNLKVVGHGSSELSWKTLADFGYYCCEHTRCLPDDESDLIYVAKSGMWMCPTHCVFNAGLEYLWEGKSFSEYKYKEYLPESEYKRWESITEWRKTNGRIDLTKPNPNSLEKIIAKGRKFIEIAGVDKIILGTDTPNPGVIAGFTIFEELCYMVDFYNLSNFEAIKAGTVNAALNLGIEKQKGMLSEGYDADMLIINGNPLDDIKNVSLLDTVIQGGRIYNRAALDAILENARNIKDDDVVSIYS